MGVFYGENIRMVKTWAARLSRMAQDLNSSIVRESKRKQVGDMMSFFIIPDEKREQHVRQPQRICPNARADLATLQLTTKHNFSV